MVLKLKNIKDINEIYNFQGADIAQRKGFYQ